MNERATNKSIHGHTLFWILVLIILPLLFTRQGIDPLMIPRMLLLSLVLSGSLVFLVFSEIKHPGRYDVRVLAQKIFPIFAAYFVVNLISLSVAVNRAEAVFELSKLFLKLGFLGIATVLLTRRTTDIQIILRSAIVAALLLALPAIGQYLNLIPPFFPNVSIVSATMVNKNLLTSYLALSVPFLLYGVLQSKGWWSVLSMLALMTASFLITNLQTRSVWVAVTASVVATMILYLKYRRFLQIPAKLLVFYQKRFFYVFNILLIVVALTLLVRFAYPPQHPKIKKETTGALTRMTSVEVRLALWQKTLRMIGDYPLTGVGAGNWKIFIPHYGMGGLPSEKGELNYVRPHNDYLRVFSETGIGGFLLFLSLFVIQFYYLYQLLRKSNPADKLLLLLLGWGLISYLVIAFFSFPGERPAHTVFLLTLTAIITSRYHHYFPKQNAPRPALNIAVLAITIAGLAGVIYTGLIRLQSEVHTKAGLKFQQERQWHASIPELSAALSPLSNLHPAGTPIVFYRGLAYARLDSLDLALRDFLAARAVHPYHILVLNNLAAAYQRLEQSEQAIAVLQEALSIAPHNEDVLLNLSAVYYKTGKYSQAYRIIQQCNPGSRNPKVQQFRRAIERKLKEMEKNGTADQDAVTTPGQR